MEALFAKQDRLLAITSTEIVRTLMSRINWNAQLISIKGPRGGGENHANVAVYEIALSHL